MSGFHEDRARQVVPRWHSSSRREGQADRVFVGEAADDQDWNADVRLRRFHERPSVERATELLHVAILQEDHGLTDLAVSYLRRSEAISEESLTWLLDEAGADADAEAVIGSGLIDPTYGQIRALRTALALEPRDPLRWLDLALAQVVVGAHSKAERSLRIAMSLAPHHRIVARGACRFYVHQGDLEQAHLVTASADPSGADPWILAARVATSSAAVRDMRRTAKRLLESRRFEPRHLSELAAAMATHEMSAGKRSYARKLVSQSLLDPTENSVAQVAWIQRHHEGIAEQSSDVLMRSPEADSWTAFRACEWGQALEFAEQWQADQIFSSRPGVHGSHLASAMLADYDRAARIAERALRSSPRSFGLRNNAAFAYAQLGLVERADALLRKVEPRHLVDSERIVLAATAGLCSYRAGQIELGQRLYGLAMESALTLKRNVQYSVAAIYFVMEEMRVLSLGDAPRDRYEEVLAAYRMATESARRYLGEEHQPIVGRMVAKATQLGLTN